MKNYLVGTCALMSFLLSILNVQAQRSKKGDNFPTYEQIRGNRHEIYDYVAPVQVPDRSNVPSEITKPGAQLISRQYNAFSYPADSTTYYLNGKQAKNQKTAEAELLEKAGNVQRVMIGAVDEKGRRVVEIDYEPKEQ